MASGPPQPWSYTRNQRYGLLLLLLLIAGGYWVNRHLTAARPPYPSPDDSALFAAARHLRAAMDVEPTEQPAAPERFRFDPNTVSAADLQRLGLSARQAASWIKFRGKRPFRSVEDIGKLYVLQPAQATTLMALAELPEDRADQVAASPPASNAVIQTFPFDPNTISGDSLALLGFSTREVKALLKYRSYRDITFREPEDLRRVGALDSERLNRLLAYVEIVLPRDSTPAYAPYPKRSAPALASLDVNTATPAAWQSLPGIGASRAASLVKFREALGGFISLDQVGTTYGLPDSTFQQIRPYLRHSPLIPSLYINRLDAAALARHPYLRRRTAEIIVRYRDNHGPFTSSADLEKVRALTTESRDALLPYLNFDR